MFLFNFINIISTNINRYNEYKITYIFYIQLFNYTNHIYKININIFFV